MSSVSSFQNPTNPAPENILSELRTIKVRHYGFDGNLHAGEIIMHTELVTDVIAFFELAADIYFPIYSVKPIHTPPFYFDDKISCEANNSSGFNYRMIAGSNRLSKHSFGRAFDINPVQNIYITYDNSLNETYRLPKDGTYDKNLPGTLYTGHPLVILMKNRGWTWGGDWTKHSGRVDYQHFEKM